MATQEYMTSQVYSATIGGVVYNVTANVGGQMDYSTDKTFGGDVTVDGNLAVGGTATTTGLLTASGGIAATALTGNLVVTGTLASSGNMSVGGDLDVTGSDIYLYNQRLITWGEGSPEGNIVGVVGCIYFRTLGGANSSLYVKESGTGNTGWKALAGLWDGSSALSAVVYDDLVVSPSSTSAFGGTAMTTAAWLTDLRVIQGINAGGEYSYYSMQLPHNYVAGTNVFFNVHFANTANITDGETVVFTMTFTSAPIWGLFGATSTATATFTNNATERAKITAVAPSQLSGTTILPNTHLISGGATITGTAFTLSTVLYGRLERSADSHASAVNIISIDAHIQKNRLGSTAEYTG